jgi:hypothetical protein
MPAETTPALVVLMEKMIRCHQVRRLIGGFFAILIIFLLLTNPTLAEAKVFYGKVVGTEFSVIQVRGDDGKVSVFWMGHRTRLGSRVPFFGDRVRIEYVKDKLRRNAVTRITMLGR